MVGTFVSVCGEFCRDFSRKKRCLLRLGISFFPMVIFTVMLFCKGMFGEFLEYAVLGVGTFPHKVTFFSYLFSTPFAFLKGIFVIFAIGISVYALFKQPEKRRLLIPYLCYAVAGLGVAYPICDEVHMSVAMVPFLPCVLQSISFPKISGRDKTLCIAMVCLVLCTLVSTDLIKKEDVKQCELSHFQGLFIPIKLEEQVSAITDYMKDKDKAGQKTAVADEYGLLYSIVLSTCHKDLDMLLLGNVGIKDVKTLLEPYEDTYLLVRKREDTLGYQAHKEVLREIKNKYEKIEEVENFEVYGRKKEE